MAHPKNCWNITSVRIAKNVRATQFHVSQREVEDYKKIKMKFQRNTKGIEAVKGWNTHQRIGQKTLSSSLLNRRKVLEEFDVDKIADN